VNCGRGVVSHDNSLGKRRHVSNGKAEGQIVWEKGIITEEVVLVQQGFECISIIGV